MHPLAWLVWAGTAGLCAMLTTNPFYLLPLFGTAVVVYVARRREGAPARAFRIFVVAGAVAVVARTSLVLLGPVTRGSVVAAVLEGLRLAVLLAVVGVFNAVGEPSRLLRLSPRRFHEASLAAGLALSLAPRTIDAVGRVREAQRLRGIDTGRLRSLSALAVPVLENGMEEAVGLAESMDARGHGRGARTRYRAEPWGGASWVVAVPSAIAGAAFVVAAALGVAALEPSTHPLVWPDVSVWLVAAVVLLAAPALPSEGR